MIYKFKSSRFLRLKKYNQQILRRLQFKASKGSKIIDTNHKWAHLWLVSIILLPFEALNCSRRKICWLYFFKRKKRELLNL